MNKEEWVVQKEGIRIDKVLVELDSSLSRTASGRLIEQGKVTVNGKIPKASYIVRKGDKIIIEKEQPKEVTLKPEKIPLNVIYEDNDIIVINKQKGIVVHPGNGNPNGTLANAILELCKDSLSGIGGEIRPGIVHRLDKDTSGLIIVAKNDKAHIVISESIKNRQVKKTYIALVRGIVREKEATIKMPIGRSEKDRKKMAIKRNGKEAITHFKVLERFNGYTLLEVKLETGRTHQIRVHLSEIGHPIVGDEVYSNGKNQFGIKGQLLHAQRLEFEHPITKQKLCLEAPIPEEFHKVILNLRKNPV